jgi:hypothetical protein
VTNDDEIRATVRTWRGVLDRFLGELGPNERTPTLLTVIAEHLGAVPTSLPLVVERWAPHENAEVQLGLEAWLAQHDLPFEVIGTSHPARRHQTFGELLNFARHDPGFVPGTADLVNVPVSPDATHPCVTFGIYLVGGEAPFAAMLRGPDPHSGHDMVQLEVISADAARATDFLAELRTLAVALSPIRGQIVTLAPPDRPGASPIAFLARPTLTREQLVLPAEALDAVERQVLAVASVKAQLRAAGQHLKRGVLLYGPPGTGKTHTVRYLLGQLAGTTVIVLTGTALHHVAAACQLARRHQPSVVVLEDVDLIAADRSFGHPGSNPLLFEVLNQLDGLGDDVDVVFLLTTNRVEVLERALSQRPGRVDEAVEIDVPDAAGREQLLRLYGADNGIRELDLADAVAGTEGLTATYLRELVRRAVLAAALDRPDQTPLVVGQEDLQKALLQLQDSRSRLTRALLGGGNEQHEDVAPVPGLHRYGYVSQAQITWDDRD